MQILATVNLVTWGIAGLVNLIFIKKIDKVSYGLMWFVLMLNLLPKIFL